MKPIVLAFMFFLMACHFSCSGKTPDKPDVTGQKANQRQLPPSKSPDLNHLSRQPVQLQAKKSQAAPNIKSKEKLMRDGKTSRSLLVPPPPPDTPILPFADTESRLQMPLYFLTLDDLKQHKKELEEEINSLKTEIQEKTEQAKQKETHAKNLADLYQEGVVSKREAEAADADKQEAEKQLNMSKSKLVELENRLNRVHQKISKEKISESKAQRKGKVLKPAMKSSQLFTDY